MAYRLSLSEPVPDAVRLVAAGELHGAADRLRGADADPVTAVHEARKSVKKTRALLRLVRPGMPRRDAGRVDEALRDAGRLLSGARDADVMVAVVDDLHERYAGRVPGTAFDELHARLAERAARARGEGGGGLAPAIAALDALAGGVDGWPLERCSWDTVRDGAVTAYGRGRRTLKAARKDPSTERLHDWRKRVKDLWYHQRLLEDLWPEVLRAHAAQTKVLSEHLGDDHDAAVLAELLGSDHDLAVDPRAAVEDVLPLLGARRTELQEQALRLGRLVFADDADAVRDRLGRWLTVAVPALR